MSSGPFLWDDLPWTWDGVIWGWDWEGTLDPDPVTGDVTATESDDTAEVDGAETPPDHIIPAADLPVTVELSRDVVGVEPPPAFDNANLSVATLLEAFVAPPVLPPPPLPEPIITVCRPRSPVLRYDAPNGRSAVLSDAPYSIPGPSLVGALTTGAELTTVSAPRQWGGLTVGAFVQPRMMMLPLTVSAGTSDELWQAREDVAGLFAVVPTAVSALPDLGRLTLERPGRPTVETAVLPVDSPRNERQSGPRHLSMEVEFFAPDPRWKENTERHALLESGGGFHGPFHGPFWSMAGSVEQTVTNTGTADAPVLVQIHGPAVGPAVECVGVGMLATKAGMTIVEGDTLVIDTTFLSRSVRLVHDNGTSENAAHLMDMAQSRFWELPAGVSILRFSGANVLEASARVSWRSHLVGV